MFTRFIYFDIYRIYIGILWFHVKLVYDTSFTSTRDQNEGEQIRVDTLPLKHDLKKDKNMTEYQADLHTEPSIETTTPFEHNYHDLHPLNLKSTHV